MKISTKLSQFFMLVVLLLPEAAFASGLDEFQGPIDKILGTVSGPVGGAISAIAIAICGITFIMKRAELGEGFKIFLSVVVGICFIALANSLVQSMFTFSGAVL
ncbi:TrbC/VirB2 family protein [Maridesulfovibrio frigidus]|uniref:TrbC/VirB2 family protein n=1 Tax=Maridesulfovibrio frigidus TaxID=340956 RepID=UPI0004E13B9B|nr:TrbC/VirB2 family protein [Maridesulfovibrio frigidus]